MHLPNAMRSAQKLAPAVAWPAGGSDDRRPHWRHVGATIVMHTSVEISAMRAGRNVK